MLVLVNVFIGKSNLLSYSPITEFGHTWPDSVPSDYFNRFPLPVVSTAKLPLFSVFQRQPLVQ